MSGLFDQHEVEQFFNPPIAAFSFAEGYLKQIFTIFSASSLQHE